MNTDSIKRDLYNAFKAEGMEILFDHETGSSTPTRYRTFGFFKSYRVFEVTGTLVQQGDRQVLMAAIDDKLQDIPVPEPNDSMTISGEVIRVVSCNPVSPTNDSMMHIVQVRK